MALADILLNDAQHRTARRDMRRALGLDLRRNRDLRIAARAGLVSGHAYDRGYALAQQALARKRLEQEEKIAAAQGLVAGKPVTAGGPAGGKPVVDAAAPVATGTQPQSLADLLSPAQQQRRSLRQAEAEAAGIVQPGELFIAYGPHANPRANEILQGGSGLAAGLGAARYDGRRRRR